MWINQQLLAIDNWNMPWHQILLKLVIYSLSLHFLIIPAFRRIFQIMREYDQ